MASTNGAHRLVRVNADRLGRERRVFGVMPFSVKVTSTDTGGNLLVIEQHNAFAGGPPRHVHSDQDEWFYVVEGRYMLEVDGQPYELGPGDSIMAPRGLPHTWALSGTEPGRMIIAFQPAGLMEKFFDAACLLPSMATPEELRPLFEAHGMKVVGPPLR